MTLRERRSTAASSTTRAAAWITVCVYVYAALCSRAAAADHTQTARTAAAPPAATSPPAAEAAPSDSPVGGDGLVSGDVSPPAGSPGALPPLLAAPAESAPDPAPMHPRAKVHYDRGLELYAAHQFAAAIAELRRGFAIEPRREFLFAEAQALRLNGDCATAIARYQEFIASGPTPLQRDAARLGIDRCGRGRAPVIASAIDPALVRADLRAPVEADARTHAADPPAWWRDTWGDSALGAGAVALGVSAGFAVASNRARDRATSAETTTDRVFDEQWSSARERRDIAVATLVGGVGLLVIGGARLLFVRRQNERHPAHPSLAFSATAALDSAAGAVAFTWQGAF